MGGGVGQKQKPQKKIPRKLLIKKISMDSCQNNICLKGEKKISTLHVQKNLVSLIYLFILFIYFYLFSQSQNLIQHEQKLLIKL